ncbi:MAG: hydroxysqualene dehydroxylase HpnE [Burkholderiales bacterium]
MNIAVPPHVAVIGGGYAGMAAAVTLAQHGVKVTVYEAGKVLGGRARQVSHAACSTPLDNGQHLLLGAYRTTLELARLVDPDTTKWLRLPLQLHTESGLQLHAPKLPAPWNMLIALLGARGIAYRHRLTALKFMLRQRLRDYRLAQDMPLIELLSAQPRELIELLWEPLCLAALNTPPATASAQVFLNVLRDSLGRSRADSDLILPTVDLSAFFPDAAAAYLRNRGGEVVLQSRIRHIARDGAGFAINENTHSHVVCAVAPQQVGELLQPFAELAEIRAQISGLRYQPITTVYLQYPPEVRLPRAMTGLTHTLAQWVFDRGISHRQHGMLAVVISASNADERPDRQTLITDITSELHRLLGTPTQPLWHQIIVEKRATFSCEAGIQRPDQNTPLTNFYLAGDYTQSDYPATLEAATQSGVKCATRILTGLIPT